MYRHNECKKDEIYRKTEYVNNDEEMWNTCIITNVYYGKCKNISNKCYLIIL